MKRLWSSLLKFTSIGLSSLFAYSSLAADNSISTSNNFATNNELVTTKSQTILLPFEHSPFPLIDSQAKTFFDINENGRRGHTSRRGGLLWEDTTYNDNRVLISMPGNFIGYRFPKIIVFLHGNQATLERDVLERQQVAAQIASADINAMLVAPQFAVDALDSSAGNFAQKNYFKKFIDEAATKTSEWQNNKRLDYQLKHAPIILVAYSGGYLAAANILEKGGVTNRIKGVILLDSLYGQEDTFAKWIRRQHRYSFFFSTYTEPAKEANEGVKKLLREKHIQSENILPEVLSKDSISFVALAEDVEHKDILTHAWVEQPLNDLLNRMKIIKKTSD